MKASKESKREMLWNFDLKETDAIGSDIDFARFFYHQILDKTFKVTMVQDDDIFAEDWLKKQREDAVTRSEKYVVCVDAYCNEKVEGVPQMYVFSICCRDEILIWLTRQVSPVYSLSVKEFLTSPNVMLIGEAGSQEVAREYFHEDIEMEPVSKVYKDSILMTSQKAKRLKRFGRGVAMDVQLEIIQKIGASSSENEELSMNDVCQKILGLPLPNFPVMPQLSPLERLPREVAEYSSVKVSLIHMLVSSLG